MEIMYSVRLVMRNKQVLTVNKVSSLRDLERGVDGRRRLRCASPAVNSVPSLLDWVSDSLCLLHRLKPAVNRMPFLRDRADRDDTPSVLQVGIHPQPCRGDTLLTAGFNPRRGTASHPQSRRDGTLLTVITCLFRVSERIFRGMSRMFPGITGALPGITGTFPGITGALPGITGTFPGITGMFPGITGAFPGITGAFWGIPRMFLCPFRRFSEVAVP
jgi:hypothetical protein